MTTVRRSLTLLLVLAAAGLVAIGAMLWLDGYRMYAVTSGSMLPSYEVGDLVVTAPPSDSYEVGDVVTFPSAPGAAQALTTHRVAEVTGSVLRTKGDANATVDSAPVDAGDVVGQVTSLVPKAGYVVVFFQQPTGVLAVLTALLTMVALWGLFFPEERPEGDAEASDPAGGDSPAAEPSGPPAHARRRRHVLSPRTG